MSAHAQLMNDLTAEIAALPPFATLSEAVAAINGQLFARQGLRGKFMQRLYALECGEVLTANIGAAIQLRCDAVLAPLTPKLDGSFP